MKNAEHDFKDDGLQVLHGLVELVQAQRRSFLALAALGLLAGLWMASRQAPTYRVEATMLLDSDHGAGVLGDLAALTSAPQAVSEMEILRSRSVAEAVVDGAASRTPGLTTRVESARLAPLPALLGAAADWEEYGRKPQLEARITGDPGRRDRPRLIARFVAPGVVELSRRGPLTGFGLGGGDPRRFEFVPGEPLEYDGLSVTLRPGSDLVGETFYLEAVRFEDALETLMLSTRVSETQRNSGVIRVVHEDSDPERAARTANALCEVYLDRNRERQEKRASQTVDFIQDQLEEQLAALEQAELEVVELQRETPSSIDIGATGEALIAQMSDLQVEKVRLRMVLAGLQDALEQLRQGNLEALSRLDAELADPVTRNYVERIAELTTESELLGRADAGVFKGVIQSKRLELQARAEAIDVQAASMEAVVALLRAGDEGALGRLVTMENAGEQDPLLRSYIERWTEYDNRLRELAVEFTEELPEIRTLRTQIEGLEARLLELLEGRLAGYRTQLEEYETLLAGYDERVEGLPGDERVKIGGALERLRGHAETHLTNRLTGLYARLSRLREEETGIEDSLAALPEDVRVLADPLRRRSSHTEIVKFLLGRKQEAEITRAATLASAEFIDQAVPAREPRGPLVPLYLLGGALLGSGCALALALARRTLDRSVTTPEQLEAATGLSLFASIPDYRRGPCKVKGVGDDFLALRDDPEGPVAEAYRSLRSNLKFVLNSGQEGLELRTLAFTSCTQGEGKSVTNVDMALAFAMTGKRVLLVDADMRRPSSNRYLGTSLSPGLSDVLRGDLHWRDCVQRGVAENLDVLPAGKQPASPGDLLAGDRTGLLVREVREAYDLVVFDVPPVLAVADIDCLAPKLDGVLLVARAGKLGDKVLVEGRRRLKSVGANLVGCVLNAARPTRGEEHYGYGYGYAYEAADHEEAA